MSTTKNHKDALTILCAIENSDNPLAEFRKLVYAITKKRPSIIVHALDVERTVHSFMLRDIIHNYTKISCIKIHRALTNEGLKESKAYVESINAEEAWGTTNTTTPASVQEAVAKYHRYMQK